MDLSKTFRVFNILLKQEKLSHFKRGLSGYNVRRRRDKKLKLDLIVIILLFYLNIIQETYNTGNSKYSTEKQ